MALFHAGKTICAWTGRLLANYSFLSCRRFAMAEEAIKVDYYAMVEEAWKVSDAAREYVKTAGREVPNQELFDKVFLPSGMVDIEKTQKESGNPPKVFFKSPYGLYYRPEHKDWIPFRHGPVSV